jgi:hypothetical protein
MDLAGKCLQSWQLWKWSEGGCDFYMTHQLGWDIQYS